MILKSFGDRSDLSGLIIPLDNDLFEAIVLHSARNRVELEEIFTISLILYLKDNSPDIFESLISGDLSKHRKDIGIGQQEILDEK
jgi:hypothetical protein